jgi:hypothetical protein
MRKPAVKATAAEKKRVRAAVDAARSMLWFAIRRLHIDDEKNPADAAHFSMVGIFTCILNDTSDADLQKYASAPDARNRLLSALQQSRAPLRPKPGRRANALRDRWYADIMENIRRRGFDASDSKKNLKGAKAFSQLWQRQRAS